jgi:hypothetical protein
MAITNITCKHWKTMCSGKYYISDVLKGEILHSFTDQLHHHCVNACVTQNTVTATQKMHMTVNVLQS